MSETNLINYKGKQLKPMKYQSTRIPTGEVLCRGTSKDGYQYIVLSYGTHPCGYVALPKKHKLNGVDYDDVNELCSEDYTDNVHGGFTFSREGLHDYIHNRWVLGWDYNHYGDKNGFIDIDGREYTVMELFDDALNAIELLRRL